MIVQVQLVKNMPPLIGGSSAMRTDSFMTSDGYSLTRDKSGDLIVTHKYAPGVVYRIPWPNVAWAKEEEDKLK